VRKKAFYFISSPHIVGACSEIINGKNNNYENPLPDFNESILWSAPSTPS
jgi:hypothetical protein